MLETNVIPIEYDYVTCFTNYMNEKTVRKIVIFMLIISGTALIINNWPW